MTEFGYVPFSKITSPGIREAYNYWKNKCAGRDFPKYENFNLNDIPACKPYLVSAEIHHLPLRLYYLFLGDELLRIEGDDITNKWLHELDDWNAVDKLNEMNEYIYCLKERAPVFGIDEIYWIENIDDPMQWAIFPFSDDGKTITHGIMYNDYVNLKGKEVIFRDGY